MSIAATIADNVSVAETLEAGVDFGSDKAISHVLNMSHTLNSGTTPAGTHVAAFQQALTAGAATIDLTALPGAGGSTFSATGKRLRYIKVRNPSANANPISIEEGASNGYALGATISLAPGQWAAIWLDGDADAVGGSDKTLDLAGTGSQALDVFLIFG